jgi:hypothetical protein
MMRLLSAQQPLVPRAVPTYGHAISQCPIQDGGEPISRLGTLLFHHRLHVLHIVVGERDTGLFHDRSTGKARQLPVRHLLGEMALSPEPFPFAMTVPY